MTLSGNFSFAFMSLLTAAIVKNSHTLAGIYFIFLKTRLKPNMNVSKKIGKVVVKENEF